MAATKQQVFAWVGALVFIFTTLAFTGAVLLQMKQNSDREKEQLALQEALNNAQVNNNQSDVQSESTIQQPNQSQENKLEGTKLSGFTAGQVVAKLESFDIKEGTGAIAAADSTITAHYTGALVKDGTIFQSSHDTGQPFTSPLSGLIEGWQIGIPGMKEGGTRRLIIPAAQAYGANERPGIPANSDLVFDIELIKIEAAQ